ncbi:T9SS type A sorting domain-containing protein [Flavobacterium ajazii]|uniref:T9SS type A sorting domain-containing protein n=1 Tax=Flavobacterium ajazii TaxID=2692318 RepID=UPI0013D7DDC0|nr:T9SS type A sorting domain-containing protein [Flavobacterium ajazii]
MIKKLLFTLFSFAIFSISYSQQEATDYISGLSEPSAIINKGNILYAQGPKNLYEINTASGSPTANVIYTAAANFYMTNLTISGNIIYIAEENYDEVANVSFGCRIISIDTNNPGAGITVIYSTPQYVSSLAITGSTIYFTAETAPDANDNFTLQVQKIDLLNPVATIVKNSVTTDNDANDLAIYENHVYISVGGKGKIYVFDIADPTNLGDDDFSFNKGIFFSNQRLFITEGNLITMMTANSSNRTTVAQNTTYKDNNNGTPFNANFRDVVLIGDKLYMTLLNQGKVVTVQDATLSNKEFNQDLKAVSVYNSKTELIVSGLENNHQADIYNLSGQLLATKQVSANDNSIDISSYSHGAYIIKLGTKSFKFIK